MSLSVVEIPEIHTEFKLTQSGINETIAHELANNNLIDCEQIHRILKGDSIFKSVSVKQRGFYLSVESSARS